jgi:LysM domain-containing protein
LQSKHIPMKKLMIATISFLVSIVSFSQPAELVIKNGVKGLYLEHKVAPKEGLFPLGRMYNVHPRHIANFNGIDFNKGLAIGQKINIPLTDTNFSQKVFEGVPVLYQTTGKESLANISVKYKPAINNLRAWNHLSNDDVTPGTKLIIGFLVTNEMQSRVVKINQAVSDEESVSNVKKQEAAEKKIPQPEIKKDTVVVEESVSNVKKQEAAEKKIPQPEIKKDTVVAEESVSNVKKQEAEKKPPMTEVKNEVTENKKPETIITKPAEITDDNGTGYFKSHFYQQVKTSPLKKEQTVTSSIFKTTSGWQDAKYYLLINGVEPGTIVKITNPSNSKTIFAKVLYAMDKIRENQGVDMRISDAAASALAVSETDKFILKVNY